MAVHPEDDELAASMGFLSDEQMIMVIPISLGLGWRNPVPLGALRIGFRPGADESTLDSVFSAESPLLTRSIARLVDTILR